MDPDFEFERDNGLGVGGVSQSISVHHHHDGDAAEEVVVDLRRRLYRPEMEASYEEIREFVRKEVVDWDDELMARARFKAFSGQRSDWEPIYRFWRDLILRIARRYGFFVLPPPHHLKTHWFARPPGLTPLCLDHVLLMMYSEGDVMVPSVDLADPRSGRVSQLLKKAKQFVLRSTNAMNPSQVLFQDSTLILTSLLKDKVDEVVKVLSETHWTSSSIVTMKKFQCICGGADEASAILSYMSACGKARYISIAMSEFIEGVKVSLSSAAVSTPTNLDSNILHLIWTTERLQQQIDLIDQRIETSRKLALASLKSGNKKVALRHAKDLKSAGESREKYTSLLNRVEEVLGVIIDAESTKRVSEAIQIGNQALKENRISLEEVQLCLQELDENIDSHKQVQEVLETIPSYTGLEDEDIEDEFKKLELELGDVSPQRPVLETRVNSAAEDTNASELTESITDAFSNLKLDGASNEAAIQKNEPRKTLEAA